jgi:hypothetical protein
VFSGRNDWKFGYDDCYDDADILSFVWESWNRGSGHESEQFLKLGVRSMMVGDYVCINGVWHECLDFGWRINVPWEEVMGDIPKEDFTDVTKKTVENALVNQLFGDPKNN